MICFSDFMFQHFFLAFYSHFVFLYSVQFVSLIERGRATVPPLKLGLLIDFLGLPRGKIISYYVASFKSELLKELDLGRSQYAELKKLNKKKTSVN